MKKTIKVLTLLPLLAAVSATARAETSLEIIITGTITPTACNTALSGSTANSFNYQNININQSKLPLKTAVFSITCQNPTKVALQTIDNRSGTDSRPTDDSLPVTASALGLGRDAKGAKIGAYIATIPDSSIYLDGTAGFISLISADQGKSWQQTSGASTRLLPGHYWYTWAKAGTTLPYAFTVMQGTLNLQAMIAPAATLDQSRPIELDGSATLQLYYL